jgi:hypothetical protein
MKYDPRLKQQVSQNEQILNRVLQNMRQLRQGQEQNIDPQALHRNMNRALPAGLRPGNVDDINRVIWPFWFTFELDPGVEDIAPDETRIGSFAVTQEAAFIAVSLTKAVFLREAAPDRFTYIDPENFNLDVSDAEGLKYVLRDSTSTREFNDVSMPVDMIGVPRNPTVLPVPILFLQNSNVEIIYTNNSENVRTYRPFVTMFGYRVRLQEYQQVLSTVSG